MEQMLQKRYILDPIATKVSIGIARVLFRSLHQWLSMSDISKELGTSRSNVSRRLPELVDIGLVRPSKKGTGPRYRIDTSSPIARPMFEMFETERYSTVEPSIRNALTGLVHDEDGTEVRSLSLFGSHTRDTASLRSDLDLCLVTEDEATIKTLKKRTRDLLPDIRVDLHCYSPAQFMKISDFVVLETLLFGITVLGAGNIFHAITAIDSIGKDYLVWRLARAKENIARSRRTEGEASRYFGSVARTTLAEIDSVLRRGSTVSKGSVSEDIDIMVYAEGIEEELAKAGDRIWLN